MIENQYEDQIMLDEDDQDGTSIYKDNDEKYTEFE